MNSEFPPPLKPASRLPGKILLGSALACAGLIVLAAILCPVDGVLGRRAWNRYVAEATARGQKLTLAEYLPPPVRDVENFAAAPVIRRIFSNAPDHPEWKNPFLVPDFAPRLSYPVLGERIDLEAWKRFCVSKK